MPDDVYRKAIEANPHVYGAVVGSYGMSQVYDRVNESIPQESGMFTWLTDRFDDTTYYSA